MSKLNRPLKLIKTSPNFNEVSFSKLLYSFRAIGNFLNFDPIFHLFTEMTEDGVTVIARYAYPCRQNRQGLDD
jgi:hypothetical protein